MILFYVDLAIAIYQNLMGIFSLVTDLQDQGGGGGGGGGAIYGLA